MEGCMCVVIGEGRTGAWDALGHVLSDCWEKETGVCVCDSISLDKGQRSISIALLVTLNLCGYIA